MNRRLRAFDRYLESRRSGLFLAVVASAFALLVGLPGAVLLFQPDSDGLFYEVQKLEIEGDSKGEAISLVFQGPMAREVAQIEDAHVRRVLDPAWVDYSTRFYERRWLVPILGAMIDPVVHHRPGVALRVTSFLGYVLLAPALVLLLRRRFTPLVSLVVAAVTLLAPPVYRWSIGMWVDSWSLALETFAVLALVLVKEKGLRWIVLWAAVLAALSVTRDAAMILLLAVLVLVLVERRQRDRLRRNLALLGTGVMVSIPVFLIGGAPVRENLAYIENGFRIPRDDSWGFVAAHYLDQIRSTVTTDAGYPFTFNALAAFVLLSTVLMAAAAVTVVLLAQRPGDFYFVVARALVPGCLLFLLIAANPQGYRLELVFLPVCAIGLAIVGQRLLYGARASPDETRRRSRAGASAAVG